MSMFYVDFTTGCMAVATDVRCILQRQTQFKNESGIEATVILCGIRNILTISSTEFISKERIQTV